MGNLTKGHNCIQLSMLSFSLQALPAMVEIWMAEATHRMLVLVGLVHSAGSTGFPWVSCLEAHGFPACTESLYGMVHWLVPQTCSTFILPSLWSSLWRSWASRRGPRVRPCRSKRLDRDLHSETLEELALEVGSIEMLKLYQAHSWH